MRHLMKYEKVDMKKFKEFLDDMDKFDLDEQQEIAKKAEVMIRDKQKSIRLKKKDIANKDYYEKNKSHINKMLEITNNLTEGLNESKNWNPDFEGFVELTYTDPETYADVMVDVLSTGEVIDIYTYKDKLDDLDFLDAKWVEGKNDLFVHCKREDYPEVIQYIVRWDFVYDEDDEEEYLLYSELEDKMEKRYKGESEQMKDVKKFNL